MKKNLNIFKEFFNSNKHLLEKEYKNWSKEKLLFQLGYEHAEDSPITRQAEEYLKDGRVDWPWLKQLNRKEKYEPNPNYMTLKHPGNIDHDGESAFVLDTIDSNTVVSQQNRIWDLNSGESRKISEEEYQLLSIDNEFNFKEDFFKKNNVYVEIDHNRVEIFLKGTDNYRSFSNHRDAASNPVYLDQDRFLTFSDDYTIRVWDVRLINWNIDSPDYYSYRLPVPIEDQGFSRRELSDFLGFSCISEQYGISCSWQSYQLWDLSTLSYTDISYSDIFSKHNLNEGEVEPIGRFFYNNHNLVLLGENGGVYVFQDNGEFFELGGHFSYINDLKFLNGRRFSTSAYDGTSIWESPTGIVASHPENFFVLGQFDDDRLICFNQNKRSELIVWNINNNQEEVYDIVIKHKRRIPTVCPVGKHELLVSNWKSPLMNWDLQTDVMIPVSETEIHVGFKPIDKSFFLGIDKPNATLYIYNNDELAVRELKAHTEEITVVKVLDDNTLLSGSWDNTIHWWDYKNNITRTFSGHSMGIKGLEQLNEDHFISWSNDDTIRLWNIERAESLSTYYFEGVDMVFIIGTERILCFSFTGEFVFLEMHYHQLKQTSNGETKNS